MDQNAARLAEQLRALTPDFRRNILVKACAFSAERLGNLDVRLSELLKAIQVHPELSREQADWAISFAEEADRRSFELEEQSAPRPEWLKLFSEARLSTAIAMGFGPDTQNDRAAFFELLKSLDHGTGLVQFIETEINAAQSV
jgi:hypothetical protein